MRGSELTFHEVHAEPELAVLVDAVFADAEVRRGMGWTPEDDVDEAMAAIHGLWEHRFEGGWTLWRIHAADALVGLAGLGPVDEEDETAWSAVYLLERGEGFGARVTERLVEHARQVGACALVAVTWAENEAAKALLEVTGFEPEGPARYDWAKESELSWEQWIRPVNP